MLLSKSGPTDFCPHSCLPSGALAGRQFLRGGKPCFATSAGAAAANAAPDMPMCQVKRAAGSRRFASTMLTVGSRLFTVPAAERCGSALGVLDALHQHLDA